MSSSSHIPPLRPTFRGLPFPEYTHLTVGVMNAHMLIHPTGLIFAEIQRRVRLAGEAPITPTALAWSLREKEVTPALANSVLAQLATTRGGSVEAEGETRYTFHDAARFEAPLTGEEAACAVMGATIVPRQLTYGALFDGADLPLWLHRLRALVQDTADPAVDADAAVRAFYSLIGGDLFEGVVPWAERARAMLVTLDNRIAHAGFEALAEIGPARFALPCLRSGARGGWIGEMVERLAWPTITSEELGKAKEHPKLLQWLTAKALTTAQMAERMVGSFLTAMANPEVKDRLECHLGMDLGPARAPRTPWDLIVEAIYRAGQVSQGEPFRFLALRVFHDPSARQMVMILVDIFEGRRGCSDMPGGEARLTRFFDDHLTHGDVPGAAEVLTSYQRGRR